jgi:predicted ATPase
MLVGRGDEQRRIDALLDQARSGVSGALIIRGEPGIGKSALLQYAAGAAEGMTLVSVTGIEA